MGDLSPDLSAEPLQAKRECLILKSDERKKKPTTKINLFHKDPHSDLKEKSKVLQTNKS